MKVSTMISVLLMCCTWSFAAYMWLKTKYPGGGLKLIENIFKETMSFEQAIKLLKGGRRIRRKLESKGYAKVIVTEGKNHQEKFGTYWVSTHDSVSDYCSFSMEDVVANDWIIDSLN